MSTASEGESTRGVSSYGGFRGHPPRNISILAPVDISVKFFWVFWGFFFSRIFLISFKMRENLSVNREILWIHQV